MTLLFMSLLLQCLILSVLLNVELANLLKLSSLNELFVHPKKTEYVVFGTPCRLNENNSDENPSEADFGT